MNEILQALILGIVQGLTELLPISSSAHLNLIPWAFNWDIPESFDVALHFGTLLSIVLFFYKDWLKLIKGGFNQVVKKEKTFEGKMFWYLVAATIPGGAIGFSQALAFIPGVSRSGVTMTAGRAMGVDRESTAKYSFLLSTPIVLGATLYKFKDFVFGIPFFVGVISSFIVGVLVIKFLLEYLKKGSFKIFAVYRIILGLAIIGLYLIRM